MRRGLSGYGIYRVGEAVIATVDGYSDICEIHRSHSPHPMRLVWHHVWPREMGGPDTMDNKVLVCDTGHYNMHRLLDDLLKHGRFTTGRGSVHERAFARKGYHLWVHAGKPGKPVYQAQRVTMS